MRSTCFLFGFLFAGCFYLGRDQAEDILRRPVTEWSSRDCLTVMLGSIRHNIFDHNSPNIKVIATPYTPSVIAAINRMAQLKEHWSDTETEHQIDTSLAYQSGMYMDWQTNRLVDRRGNYLKGGSQFEELQFIITLRNASWPCNVPIQTVKVWVGGALTYMDIPLANPADWPCYMPDITNLDQQISLWNDKGDSIRPRFVWGRRNSQLTMEEKLVVMFDLKRGSKHFYDGSKNIYLLLTGFDANIRLEFPLPTINPPLKQIAVE